MKNIAITLIIFILFGCSSNEKNNLQEMNLKGNIKSVKEIYYDGNEKFGEYVKEEWKYTIEYFFNENGNITERNSYYAPKNSIRDKTKYIYNNNNQIIEEYKYDSNGNLESTEKYKYDKKGNKIEKVTIEDNKITITEKYIYDSKENLIEIQSVIPDGIITYAEKFIYNSDNLLTKKIEVFYNDDSSTSETICNYNEKGQIKEVNNQNSNSIAIKYIYDNNGEQTKQINYHDDGTPSGDTFETTIKYDDKGNWINKSIIGKSEWSKKSEVKIEEREIVYYN